MSTPPGFCVAGVRFMADVAAAAAAGAITPLIPIPIAGSSLITPGVAADGSADFARDGSIVFADAGVNLAAAVRLATTAGVEAYRDAIDGLVVNATLNGRQLLDNVSFRQLAGGLPSVLITAGVDMWTPPGSGMPLAQAVATKSKLSVSVIQTRITTVAMADLYVGFNARLEI